MDTPSTTESAEPAVNRRAIRQSLRHLFNRLETEALRRREKYFRPERASAQAYQQSLESYRKDLTSVLGWPLNLEERPEALVRSASLDPEEHGGVTVSRLSYQGVAGVEAGGLFFQAKPRGGEERRPLVILLHGGQGGPETVIGKDSIYHGAHRRLLKAGISVYIPQLLSWGKCEDAPVNRVALDASLKRFGSSLAAVEVSNLLSAIDYFRKNNLIQSRAIGLAGFAYGGFIAFHTAALDPRVAAVAASGYLSAVPANVLTEASWAGGFYFFSDAEIGGMVCPRPLFLEVGLKDKVIKEDIASQDAGRIGQYYQALGLDTHYEFHQANAAHEFFPDEKGVEFLTRHLLG